MGKTTSFGLIIKGLCDTLRACISFGKEIYFAKD